MPEIKFNTCIYKKEAVKKAMADYSGLAEFSVSQNNRYFKVRIDKISPRFRNIIVDDFANYVLWETKKCL